jgi:hypothetical protein
MEPLVWGWREGCCSHGMPSHLKSTASVVLVAAVLIAVVGAPACKTEENKLTVFPQTRCTMTDGGDGGSATGWRGCWASLDRHLLDVTLSPTPAGDCADPDPPRVYVHLSPDQPGGASLALGSPSLSPAAGHASAELELKDGASSVGTGTIGVAALRADTGRLILDLDFKDVTFPGQPAVRLGHLHVDATPGSRCSSGNGATSSSGAAGSSGGTCGSSCMYPYQDPRFRGACGANLFCGVAGGSAQCCPAGTTTLNTATGSCVSSCSACAAESCGYCRGCIVW